MEETKKYYRISLECGDGEGACFRALTEQEYNLINGIFDDCDLGKSIEEVVPKWVIKVNYKAECIGYKHDGSVVMLGRIFVPVDDKSLYKSLMFYDLPEQPGLPERRKHFYYDDFAEYYREAHKFADEIGCKIYPSTLDELKNIEKHEYR